jgi:hypothetical protein
VKDGARQRQFRRRDGMEDQLVNNRAMERLKQDLTALRMQLR